jgi:signal transduction histidine kinase
MSFRLIIVFFFISFFGFSTAAKSQDSIVKAVTAKYNIDTSNDSVAFYQLFNVGWDLLDGNIEEFKELNVALKYYEERLEESVNKTVFYSDYNNVYAKYNYLSGYYDSAIYYYETSISALLDDTAYVRAHKGTNDNLASFYNNLALIYDEIGFYKNAIDLQFKSIEQIENARMFDTTNVNINRLYATDYLELGLIYSGIDDTINALKYFKKGVNLCHLYGNKEIIAYAELNYGVFLLNINKIEEAEVYLLQNVDFYERTNNNYDIIIVKLNLAELELKKNNIPKSLKINKEVRQLTDSLGFEQLELVAYNQLFNIYDGMDSLDLALKYGEEYLKFDKDKNSYGFSEMLEAVASLYHEKGNSEIAYNYNSRAKRISDSLNNEDKLLTSNLLSVNYDIQKINNNNKKLLLENYHLDNSIFRQRVIISMILSLLVLFFGLIIVVYVNNRKKTKLNRTLEDVNNQLLKKSKDLEESKDVLETIFSVISHDLKGPIGTADVFFELLSDKSNNIDADQKDMYINTIGESLKSTHHLLEDILNWSRNRMGKKVNISDVFIKKLIDDVIHTIDNTVFTKSIVISNSIDDKIKISTDENYLKIIIRNIISNAVKFTNKGGKIDISCTRNGKAYSIIIKDSGVGMSEELVSKIMSGNQYKSSDGTISEKGTGMGLLICFELAESIDAEIDINSKLNQGTTFTIKMKD